MYKTILFDLDGTLSNSGDGITRCAQHALRHYGIDVPNLDDLTCFVGPPPAEMFMKGFGLSYEQADEASHIFRKRYAEKGVHEHYMYPGVKDLLHKLKQQGKTIALATSKPVVFARDILEGYGILQYFDIVVGSELTNVRASKNKIMEQVLEELNIITQEQKKSVVMVGDRYFDVEGSIHCGIDCIGVGYGYAEPNELQQAGAKWFCSTVEDLEKLLLNE